MIDALMTREIEVPPHFGVQEIVAYLCAGREVDFEEPLQPLTHGDVMDKVNLDSSLNNGSFSKVSFQHCSPDIHERSFQKVA